MSEVPRDMTLEATFAAVVPVADVETWRYDDFNNPPSVSKEAAFLVYTEDTPVACITNTTVFSQAQITYALVAQGSSRIVSSLRA